jgi:hypothetical protein
MVNCSCRSGGSDGKERSGFFLLDANNATVYFKRAAVEINNLKNFAQDDPVQIIMELHVCMM